jgi:hypothetical protein
VESKAPSVVIGRAAPDGTNYRFYLLNNLTHAVTAFTVRLIPDGVEKVDGVQRCHGRCSGSSVTGSKTKPVIKPGASYGLNFEISSVANGLVLQAVLFDDDTYEGEEQAAANLAAGQMGEQFGYNRVVETAAGILSKPGMDDVQKASRMLVELDSLSTTPDATMLNAFNVPFANLAGCDHQFGVAMKNAAAAVKQTAQDKVHQFLAGSVAKGTSLAEWWDQTRKEDLSAFGCDGCSITAARPKPSATVQAAAGVCDHRRKQAATLVDIIYEIEFDVPDEMLADAEADDEADDTISNQPGIPLTPTPARAVSARVPPKIAAPADESSVPAPAEHDVPPAPVVTETPHVVTETPQRMAPLPRPPASPGQFRLWAADAAHLLPNDFMYREYFAYVAELDQYADKLEAMGRGGSEWRTREQRAAQLSDKEWKIVQRAATECNEAVTIHNERLRKALTAYWAQLPPALPGSAISFFPGKPAFNETGVKLVLARIDDLKVQLGEGAFKKFDNYLHAFYDAEPARTVFMPLPDDLIFGLFFQYVAALERAASDTDVVRLRMQIQSAAGLSNKEWTTLALVASENTQALMDNGEKLRAAMTSFRSSMINQGATVPPSTSVSMDAKLSAARQDFEKARNQIVNAHIQQLKSKLFESSFTKLNSCVRDLYKSYQTTALVPLSDPKAKPIPLAPMGVGMAGTGVMLSPGAMPAQAQMPPAPQPPSPR